MKKIFFLLIGISLFYSAYATNHDVNTGEANTSYETNPDTSVNSNTSNNDGLGNAGNTTGIGTDHGGGNGPSN